MAKFFVYGTLKRGYNMERIAPSATFISEAFLNGAKLYDLGAYPAMVKAEEYVEISEEENTVYGELWEVPATEDQRALDRYEGSAYYRTTVSVFLHDGEEYDSHHVSAETYFYNSDPSKYGKYLPNGEWERKKST